MRRRAACTSSPNVAEHVGHVVRLDVERSNGVERLRDDVVAPARRDERRELVLELRRGHRILRIADGIVARAAQHACRRRASMRTRVGHALGYFAVRSGGDGHRGATRAARRSSDRRHRRSEKWSAENTSSGAPPYSSAAATQYARLNFAAYGVRRILLLHDLVSRAVRLDVDRRDVAQRVAAFQPRCARRSRATSIARVRVAAARPHLVAVLADLPALAQSVGDARSRRARRAHRAEEAAIALENAPCAGEARSREIGGQHAVERRLSRMQVLAHRAVGVELPQPGGLRSRRAERVEHLLGVEPEQRAGGRGGAERRGGAGGMPEAIVARIHRFADAQRGVVAERDGEQERPSGRVLAFGDGQRRRR